jgi:hypothetical protein
MYSIENALMIICINSQIWGEVIVIRLVIDYGELLKVALKKEEVEKELMGGLRIMRFAGVLGTCVFWCVFLLS